MDTNRYFKEQGASLVAQMVKNLPAVWETHRGLGASVQHLLGLPVRRPEKEMGTIPR